MLLLQVFLPSLFIYTQVIYATVSPSNKKVGAICHYFNTDSSLWLLLLFWEFTFHYCHIKKLYKDIAVFVLFASSENKGVPFFWNKRCSRHSLIILSLSVAIRKSKKAIGLSIRVLASNHSRSSKRCICAREWDSITGQCEQAPKTDVYKSIATQSCQ